MTLPALFANLLACASPEPPDSVPVAPAPATPTEPTEPEPTDGDGWYTVDGRCYVNAPTPRCAPPSNLPTPSLLPNGEGPCDTDDDCSYRRCWRGSCYSSKHLYMVWCIQEVWVNGMAMNVNAEDHELGGSFGRAVRREGSVLTRHLVARIPPARQCRVKGPLCYAMPSGVERHVGGQSMLVVQPWVESLSTHTSSMNDSGGGVQSIDRAVVRTSGPEAIAPLLDWLIVVDPNDPASLVERPCHSMTVESEGVSVTVWGAIWF